MSNLFMDKMDIVDKAWTFRGHSHESRVIKNKIPPNFPLAICRFQLHFHHMDTVLEPISLPESTSDKPKRRKLTGDDISNVAKLVSRRKLNESEACAVLDINYEQWRVFKCRAKHSKAFETIITRTKGFTINHAIERLERAGEDMEITLPNGKVITKRGDWRADAARLPLIDPERFGDRQQPANQTNVLIGDDVAARMIELFKQSKQRAIESQVVETKQLNNEYK